MLKSIVYYLSCFQPSVTGLTKIGWITGKEFNFLRGLQSPTLKAGVGSAVHEVILSTRSETFLGLDRGTQQIVSVNYQCSGGR